MIARLRRWFERRSCRHPIDRLILTGVRERSADIYCAACDTETVVPNSAVVTWWFQGRIENAADWQFRRERLQSPARATRAS